MAPLLTQVPHVNKAAVLSQLASLSLQVSTHFYLRSYSTHFYLTMNLQRVEQ